MNSVVHRATRCLFNLRMGKGTPSMLLRALSSAAPDAKDESKAQEAASASEKPEESQDKAAEEITRLNESLSVMKDKYQRSIAENENVRKRLRKEISDAKLYAIQGFCKDLLDVADVLDTAVNSVAKDTLDAKDDPNHKEWKDFYDGVSSMHQELQHVFQRHGLVAFKPSKGDKFDPKYHDAMFQAQVPDLESGLIAHVQSTGYMLHERTVRPSQVGVAK